MADSSSDSETESSIPSVMEQLFGRSTDSHTPTSLVPTISPGLLMLQALRLSLLQSLRDSLVDNLASLFSGSSDAYKMFLPNGAESESVMFQKNLEKWSKVQHPEGQGNFSKSFVSEVNKFLNNDFQRKCRRPKSVSLHQPIELPSEGVVQFLSKFVASDPSMLSLEECVNNLLTSVFQEAQNLCSVAYLPHQHGDKNIHVNVTDFSAVSDENLNDLISLFKPRIRSKSREDALERLSQYVPKKQLKHKANDLTFSSSLHHTGAVQCVKCSTHLTRSNPCSQCRKPFCSQCLNREGKVLSQGSMKVMPLCSDCHDDIQMSEVQGWKEKGIELLATGISEDIQAAIACLLMQLYANRFQERTTAISMVNKFAKQLVQEDLPELAIPILIAITQQNEAPTEKLRAHVLASKAFESLAYSPNTLRNEQIPLLKAAVEECTAASKVKASGIEVPDLSLRMTSLEKTISVIKAKDEYQLNRAKQVAYSKLNAAWIKGDWDSIFLLISEKASDHLKRLDGENPTIEAIKEFIKTNDEETLHEKRLILTFLQGIIDIFNKNLGEGLKNLEVAVWGSGGKLSEKFFSAAIDAAIGVLLQNSEHVIPLQKLLDCCEIVTKGGSLDPSTLLPSLSLKEEDLFPPFKLQWSLSHHLLSRIKSFEDFATQKVTKGEWTCINVAENYLDMIEKCHDTTEIVSCFINAALWMLKMLQQKSAEPCTSFDSEIYSFKKAVFHYVRQAFIITVSCLHTGMQFYVARIAVAATVVASKYAGVQATPNDAAEITQFLYTFVHTARFCPFWKAPIVLVSECTTVSEMIERQYCLFLSKLDHIPEEFHHLKQFELSYKLYENDFTGLQKLENPEEMKLRAMQELLQKKGLTWENVSSLMNTSLCKRTPEGWICNQQPVGTDLEFAEIKGLRVHLSPSTYSLLGPQVTVELLVIRSNGSNGLVSLSDMYTFLTIDKSELMPLYFSLDPPSRDEKFHPFQELRFHPKALKNTEVLETMLDADYLMKFFSVGSEVSANPPFKQRPCIDGLVSTLPHHLREALKSVPEYGNAKSSLYRFWIEAKELKYDIEQSGNVITVKCGSPEMIIKKHRMYHDPDGQMRDTEEDDDPNSAESQFAAAMTENYDEIGQYFLAFARLKELCKLQLLTTYVKNNIAEFSTKAKVEVTDIEENAKVNVTAKIADKPNLPCWWVPASVSRRNTGYCYGGVNLAPHYVKSSLPALPQNTVPVVLPKVSSRINEKASKDSDSSSASGSSWGSFVPQHRSTPMVRQNQDSRSSTRPQGYTSNAQPTYMAQQQPPTPRSSQQSSLPRPVTSNLRPGGSNTPNYQLSTPRRNLTRESQSTSTRAQHITPRTGSQNQPSSTSISTNQSGSLNVTQHTSGQNTSSLPSDTFKATSTMPSAKPMIQPPIVIITPAGCRELPIAKALLSTPVNCSVTRPHVFCMLPEAIWKLLTFTSNCSSVSHASSSGDDVVAQDVRNHQQDGGNSRNDDGDSDRRQECDIPRTVLNGVMCALASAVHRCAQLKTSDLRDSNAQREYRKKNNIKDPTQHVAHILSLEVVIFIVIEGISSGTITIAIEKVLEYLKKAVNVEANFQTVRREVNLGYHREYDAAIINGDLSDQNDKSRGNDIIEFVEHTLVTLIPYELTVAFLKVFRRCRLITKQTYDHIEIKAKEVAPKIPK